MRCCVGYAQSTRRRHVTPFAQTSLDTPGSYARDGRNDEREPAGWSRRRARAARYACSVCIRRAQSRADPGQIRITWLQFQRPVDVPTRRLHVAVRVSQSGPCHQCVDLIGLQLERV